MEAAGDLTGTKVVVHVYPDQDEQRFVDTLKLAQRTLYVNIALSGAVPQYDICSHPNILSVMGYSRPGGLGQAARYIVTEGTATSISLTTADIRCLFPRLNYSPIDYIPFTEHFSSLRGTSKLRMYLQMARSHDVPDTSTKLMCFCIGGRSSCTYILTQTLTQWMSSSSECMEADGHQPC